MLPYLFFFMPLAWVATRNYQAVVDAALDCPGECIFIEIDEESAA